MAATAWCGTLHLDTEEFDGETFLKQLVEAKRIAYGIGQIERGALRLGVCTSSSTSRHIGRRR